MKYYTTVNGKRHRVEVDGSCSIDADVKAIVRQNIVENLAGNNLPEFDFTTTEGCEVVVTQLNPKIKPPLSPPAHKMTPDEMRKKDAKYASEMDREERDHSEQEKPRK